MPCRKKPSVGPFGLNDQHSDPTVLCHYSLHLTAFLVNVWVKTEPTEGTLNDLTTMKGHRGSDFKAYLQHS